MQLNANTARAGMRLLAGALGAAMAGITIMPAAQPQAPTVEERLDRLERRVGELTEILRKQAADIDLDEAVRERYVEISDDVRTPLEPGSAVLGSAAAKIAIVEFSDVQCPYCGEFVRIRFPELQREFIDTGTARYVARHFPLEAIHSSAFKLAEAIECAGDQNRWWELRLSLFGNQGALTLPDVLRRAELLGLAMPRFRVCLQGKDALAVRRDIAEGLRLGVDSTPTFFVGYVQNSEAVLRFRIRGSQALSVFERTVARAASRE
jgi:protein-disulfide isomerase